MRLEDGDRRPSLPADRTNPAGPRSQMDFGPGFSIGSGPMAAAGLPTMAMNAGRKIASLVRNPRLFYANTR